MLWGQQGRVPRGRCISQPGGRRGAQGILSLPTTLSGGKMSSAGRDIAAGTEPRARKRGWRGKKKNKTRSQRGKKIPPALSHGQGEARLSSRGQPAASLQPPEDALAATDPAAAPPTSCSFPETCCLACSSQKSCAGWDDPGAAFDSSFPLLPDTGSPSSAPLLA